MDKTSKYLPTPYQQFIYTSRYARWIEELGRREFWEETVDRAVDFLFKETNLSKSIREEVRSAILNLEALPSMRLMMSAGEAADRENFAIYNCAYTPIDKPRRLAEILYILMNGTGIGFSVERQEIATMPRVPSSFDRVTDSTFIVGDSKRGWAEAYLYLLENLYSGTIPKFDFSRIRPAGARLKVFGGRASGPQPLKELFDFTINTFLNAAQRSSSDFDSNNKLTSIELHDIVCKIGEVVVVGGVRRCLDKDTVLYGEKGITTLETVKIGEKIQAENGKMVEVLAKENTGVKKGYRVTTTCGEIIMSEDHRMAVFDSVKNQELSFKEAKDISIDDVLYFEKDSKGEESFIPARVINVEHTGNIETYDIEVSGNHVFLANGHLSHNSALISLSNLSDNRMREAKAGQWWENNSQRALANNSAVYDSRPDVGQFMDEWNSLYKSKSGERGIFNRASAKTLCARIGRDPNFEFGTNPCSEILLRPQQNCNLSEVVVRESDTYQDIERKVEIAAIIGTLQSRFTKFKFVEDVWSKNCQEEALLGVSMTGIFDRDIIPEEDLEDLNSLARATNIRIAKQLGINPSAAVTAVKPSGTVSQLVNCASGIHPRHSKYYIRSVRGDNKDPLTEFLKDQGIPNEPEFHKPDSTTVFYFPVKSPDSAKTRDDVDSIEHLETWLHYQKHWCDHKPSVTINVKEHEWPRVGAWVWDNFDWMSGVSFLPHDNHSYQQAPYQECTEEEFLEMDKLVPKVIDWTKLKDYEKEDTTKGNQELACSAGSCEIVDI